MSADTLRPSAGADRGQLDLDDPAVRDAIAEARELAAGIRAAAADIEPVYRLGAQATRRRRLEGGGVLGPPVLLDQATTDSVPGRDGDIPIRILTPPDPVGVYLHLHGGGWVIGSASEQDEFLWELACATRSVVVSVEYRLAPEHPFPAAVHDCEDVAAWLRIHARDRFGAERLAIGGESAGAHLAATSLLRMRDRDDDANAHFAVADLSYGVFDLSMTPSQRAWGPEELVISTPTMAWFYDCFVPRSARRRSAGVSPLYADLQGLPPALFTVGTLDPLLDDSLFMAARWQAAGNETRLMVYPEAVHGFTLFPHELATMANSERYAFITRHLAAPQPGE